MTERPAPPTGDEDAPPDAGPWTIPNALTALRMVLAPVFLVLYLAGDRHRALAAFAAAAATDLLDGLAARLLRQRSRLGAILDPGADKLLALCALVALAGAGRLPAWLAALVVGRDLAQVVAALGMRAAGLPVPVRPTRAGKYATSSLALLVVLALAVDVEALRAEAAAPWLAAVGVLATSCVAVSLVQYGAAFVALLSAPARGR